ncbi:RNA polymerase sigma-70 factor, partial [Parapedobacter defluvii]|uniref:RNA polymerase sigma-70 factor n=1 Tax=Parapedobacter defluvii TaxID=2045106 RepID=UPI00333E61A2
KTPKFDPVITNAMTQDAENTQLLEALRNGDVKAFEQIYLQMGEKLLHYVHSRVQNREVSEELVQEIFVSLWSRRHELGRGIVLEPYLFSAAKYKILSHIRSEKVRQRYAEHFALFVAQQHANTTADLLDMADLEAVIEERISTLPPKCQQAFRMSRFAHKSIAEIADEMDISARTVENYITKALKYLREALSRGQWTFVLIWCFLFRF